MIFSPAQQLTVVAGGSASFELDTPPSSRALWTVVSASTGLDVTADLPVCCGAVPAWLGRVPVQRFTVSAARAGRYPLVLELRRPFASDARPLDVHRLTVVCCP